MNTHREIIGLWPTRVILARELGVSDGLVHAWHRRDSIPTRYWQGLAKVARDRGLIDITADLLASIKARDPTPISPDLNERGMA